MSSYASLGGADDTLLGTNGSDVLSGGGGNETILALDGADLLHGGPGNDLVYAGSGKDLVFTGPGDDTAYGNAAQDTLLGEGGNDLLDGGNTDDVLFGGTGDDTLLGGREDDVLEGGVGDDVLTGGGLSMQSGNPTQGPPPNDGAFQDGGNNGNDTFYFDSGFGRDTITDFNRADDVLEIRAGINGTGITQVGDLLAPGVIVGQGSDTVIHLGSDSITLVGVKATDLLADLQDVIKIV